MSPVFYHAGCFPPGERLEWRRLIPLIGPAASALARYDGVLAAVPNPRILLAPLATREAVLSSRIEGTQATMDEVLQFEAGQEPALPQRRNDILEVLNYRAAMRQAENFARGVTALPTGCQGGTRDPPEGGAGPGQVAGRISADTQLDRTTGLHH